MSDLSEYDITREHLIAEIVAIAVIVVVIIAAIYHFLGG